MMPKVKICGITNAADALKAVQAGCDALGFVFYRKSPRYIGVADAAAIIRQLKHKVYSVGVFVNAAPAFVRSTARSCGLDMVQLHGEESDRYCRSLKGLKVIKAIRVKEAPCADIVKYRPWAFLFDSRVRGVRGGSGTAFDWELLSRCRGRIRQKVFLSGGLNSRSVAKAIRAVRPDWVDVSSSVESCPGKKDPRKVESFIKAVKKARLR